MKVLVYGAGSIGCYIGAILHNQGVGVRLLGRQRILDAANKRGGFFITDYEGRESLVNGMSFSTTPDVLASADIVLVTLKCTAIASAIGELKQYCRPDALIIALQNGVGAPELLQQALPQHTVLPGIVPFNVVQLPDSQFHRATEGALHFPAHERLELLQSAYIAYGLPCELHEDIEAVIWGKLQLNLNNAINALSDIPLKAELGQRGYRRVLAKCQQELLQVCAAKHIKMAKLTAVPPRLLPFILNLPDWLFQMVAQKMLTIDPGARSSMWEDLQLGRKTEIDFLNGAVVRLAQEIGVPAPANAKVTELVKQRELDRSLPAISGAGLLRELG